MKIPNERTPPQQAQPITCEISGLLAYHIKQGAALSGLTPAGHSAFPVSAAHCAITATAHIVAE